MIPWTQVPIGLLATCGHDALFLGPAAATAEESGMFRKFSALMVVLLVAAVAGCASQTKPQTEAEAIVDKARATLETFKDRIQPPGGDFRAQLKSAKGVLIFPDVFKVAVGIGGQGGTGVLLVRDRSGNWSYPAFYSLGGGSAGIQLGASSTQLVFILKSERAVKSVVLGEFQIGGDVQWTAGSHGAGYTVATTTNLGADVIGFAIAEGLFAGFSLQAGSIGRRIDLNEAYYRKGAAPEGILYTADYFNVHADPLRRSLAAE
jgi:lipid-binding SYLF domain-containing protein